MSKATAAIIALSTIAIQVGDYLLHFDVDDGDINRYLNEQQPNEKIKSAYNFLSRSIVEDDRELFKSLALSKDGVTPRGVVVMQIAILVASEFGGELDITVKKPNSSAPESNATATAS